MTIDLLIHSGNERSGGDEDEEEKGRRCRREKVQEKKGREKEGVRWLDLAN